MIVILIKYLQYHNNHHQYHNHISISLIQSHQPNKDQAPYHQRNLIIILIILNLYLNSKYNYNNNN